MNNRPTNFRTLDLNLLKVFDVVMVERNVTRAAARLAMTQPAVSNALRRLRESTREELFIPSSTGVTPTARAEALWPTVRSSLDSLHEAFEPKGFDPAVDAHTFTLAMADATAALFVPVLVARLLHDRARVHLRFVPLTTRDPRAMLEQGGADVALGFFPEVAAALAEDNDGVVQREQLYECGYVCVMRRRHRLATPGALTLDAYCDAQHLRVAFADQSRGFVDEALERLGRSRHVMVTVNSFFTAGAAVHQSDLLTVLPASFFPAAGFTSKLTSCALPFELPGIDVSMLWHRRQEQEPAHAWLREAVVRAAAEISAGT
jgi:DNA-binding transcriptional LysR family regulator